MFTPGDNDWTDCDRPSNGSFNSLERLDYERQLFFSTPTRSASTSWSRRCRRRRPAWASASTRGHDGLRREPALDVQGRHLRDAQRPGLLQQPLRHAPDPAEYTARNAADIAWLQQTFAEAKARSSVAVMIIWQADPGFDGSDVTGRAEARPEDARRDRRQRRRLPDFLPGSATRTIAFEKPVALVHGDSHYFRIDKPLLDASRRARELHARRDVRRQRRRTALNDVHWVKVLVDPKSRDVFAFQPQIVPATASPSPLRSPSRSRSRRGSRPGALASSS